MSDRMSAEGQIGFYLYEGDSAEKLLRSREVFLPGQWKEQEQFMQELERDPEYQEHMRLLTQEENVTFSVDALKELAISKLSELSSLPTSEREYLTFSLRTLSPRNFTALLLIFSELHSMLSDEVN